MADVSSASWIPSQEAERIPEIRHNLRLIVSSAKSDLDGLAREAKTLESRKKWVRDEEARLGKIVESEARGTFGPVKVRVSYLTQGVFSAIARLQQISKVVEDVNIKSKEIASHYEATLDVFTADFDKLSLEYSTEYERYQLDEVVVGAIAPYVSLLIYVPPSVSYPLFHFQVRRRFTMWNPLQEPEVLTAEFRKWKRLLRISKSRDPGTALIDRHNMSEPTKSKVPARSDDMTPYESLMWNVWLPRMRSAIKCVNYELGVC